MKPMIVIRLTNQEHLDVLTDAIRASTGKPYDVINFSHVVDDGKPALDCFVETQPRPAPPAEQGEK